MDISLLLLSGATVLFFILFLPDLLPYCRSCKRLKLRWQFKYHQTGRSPSGYASNMSLCTKCCRKFGINSMEEARQLVNIRKKIEMDTRDKIS